MKLVYVLATMAGVMIGAQGCECKQRRAKDGKRVGALTVKASVAQ